MSSQTLAELVTGTAELSTLASLLEVTGLDLTLRESGPYTLFAPTDEAFVRLPAGLLAALKADPSCLRGVLSDHVVHGHLVAADLMGLSTVTAISGKQFTLSSAGGLRVERIYLVAADQLAANGVVHQINSMMLLL